MIPAEKGYSVLCANVMFLFYPLLIHLHLHTYISNLFLALPFASSINMFIVLPFSHSLISKFWGTLHAF